MRHYRVDLSPKRQPTVAARHACFLAGALNTVTRDLLPPVNAELLQDYLLGAEMADRGFIRITDPDAMRAFIEEVRMGRWPPKRETP